MVDVRIRSSARIVLAALSLGLLFVGTTASTEAATSVKRSTSASSTAKKRHTSRYTAQTARTRRARLARAKSAARARQWREVSEPRFKTNDMGEVVPDIRAEAAIIYNPETNQVLWE